VARTGSAFPHSETPAHTAPLGSLWIHNLLARHYPIFGRINGETPLSHLPEKLMEIDALNLNKLEILD